MQALRAIRLAAEGFQSDYSTPLIRISMYHRYTPAIPETVDEIRWLI